VQRRTAELILSPSRERASPTALATARRRSSLFRGWSRCHDEQLIVDLNPLWEIWIEGLSIVSNDQGHRSRPPARQLDVCFWDPRSRPHWPVRPEFAAAGKERVEVRHLLSHSSGLGGWTEKLSIKDLYAL
jgi:hypothetical protein